jgi:flagella basal body P-ring formation protein FlgA
LISLKSVVRALPFIGALLVGAASPRAMLAQSNGESMRVATAETSSSGASRSDEPKFRVAVATRTLARGTVLSADDFELRDTTGRFISTLPDTTPVVAGWVTRRTINAGEILRSPAVEPPAVVNANSPVLIEWVDGNVRLTVSGIAARDGALGERIPVRTDTGKRFEATVVAPGRVRID